GPCESPNRRELAHAQIFGPFFHVTAVAIIEPRPLGPGSQLLHKRGNSGVSALPNHGPGPLEIEWPSPCARLSADDDPVDIRQPWPEVDRSQSWLIGHESHRCRNLREDGDSVFGLLLSLRADTDPHIWQRLRLSVRKELERIFRALCQHNE